MGFCTDEQHRQFLELCPQIDKYAVDGGIMLITIWLEVRQEEQEKRFSVRINDPLRQWKLSQIDLESSRGWYDYSRARAIKPETTARLNCISHILQLIPFNKVSCSEVKLPKRSNKH